MLRLVSCVLGGMLSAVPALGERSWFSYEGNDLPENVGWTRVWGNNDGPYQGSGANRQISDGALVTDSLYDTGVYDYNQLQRPGSFRPGPGEVFRAEWRLRVTESHNWSDQSFLVAGDNGSAVALGFFVDRVQLEYEHDADVPFEPLVWHRFAITSADMVTYELWIDGTAVHSGQLLTYSTQSSVVGFGDGVQGASSLASWDYVRFGVVPEPAGVRGVACALSFVVARVWRRIRPGGILRKECP